MNTDEANLSTLEVERHGIDYVQPHQRYGRPRNQFTIRFAPVIYLAGIFVGATGGPLGLGLWGSITAIVAANILGSIGTALCALMGPKLGMPQLLMGRAAFGHVGNYLPAALTVVICVGYYTVGTILGAKSLADLFDAPNKLMVVLVAALSIVVAIYGYQFLHVLGRWITYVSIVVLAAVSVYLIAHGGGSGVESTLSGTSYTTAWLVQFTVVFGYTVSWSPYASDYSRYLPERTSSRSIFGWASTGLLAATTWMMVLGAGLISLNPDGDVLDAFDIVLPSWLLYVTLLTLGISAIPHNSVNLYSGAMSLLTCNVRVKQVVIVIVAGSLGGLLGLVFGGDDFQQNFGLFLHVMSYYITPWLAILLVAYFKVYKNGNAYPPSAVFYDRDGGFRGVKWTGLGALLVSVAVSIPFMGNELYTGPVAAWLNGADFSYFVSAVVAAVIYLAVAKPVTPARAPDESSRTA